jgi:hypothetical protein
LGVGDVSIATTQSSGGTVTIGSSNTLTTFGGKVSYGGLVQGGNTDYNDTYPTAGVYTIPTTINREFFVIANVNCTGVVFPTGVAGQIINVKNQSGSSVTLSGTGTVTLYPSGTITGTSTYSLTSGSSQRFYFYTSGSLNIWMGI